VSDEIVSGDPVEKLTVFAPFMKGIGLSLAIIDYKNTTLAFARK
jgi:hypothetical protein